MFALFALLLQSAVAIPTGWKTYENTRYNYTTCYPATLKVLPESINAWGRTAGTGDTVVSSWGQYNVDKQTISSYMASTQDMKGKVVYQKEGANWRVEINSIAYDQTTRYIVWRKTFKRANQFITIEVRYTGQNMNEYASTIKAVEACSSVQS